MSEASGRASAPTETTVASVISIIRSSQNLPADEPLDGATCLIERGLALDSVALLELALALEEHFEFRVEDHELTSENFGTVTTVARLIEQKSEASAATDA